ncbi:MAG TPA: hypothetical protein VMF03_20150 [Steroidobacteraceae bacterium]|nr:hypothetical protein [Steroidobacteraceae bacterium]
MSSVPTHHLAQAEASIMLIEVLMALLIERAVLPRESVIEAVETVIDVKRRMAAEGAHPEVAAVARGLLSTLANSLMAASADGPIAQ